MLKRLWLISTASMRAKQILLINLFLAVLLFAVAGAAEPKTVLRFLVEPDPAGRFLKIQAAFDLAKLSWTKAPYLQDYNQLQEAGLDVDGTARDLMLERNGDLVSFAGLPRKGQATLTYTLFCVTEPRPGYRKRLMGGPGFVMARTGIYLGIPGREGEPVEVSWQLPDGWELGLGWQGRRAWRETQDTIWLAGRLAGRSAVEVDGRRLSVCIMQGVAPEAQPRLGGMIETLFPYAWRTCGPLDDADYGIAVMPRWAIGGGTSLAYSLIAEENPSIVAHELLHWWTNEKAPAWFREGVHDYIAVAMLKRLGHLSEFEFARYIQDCLREHERVVRDEGGLSTLAASSEAYDRGKGGGDIYGLMPLLAYRLDCEIRRQSGGAACLEDVFARVSRERTVRPDLPKLIEKVTGYDPRSLFDRYFHAEVADPDELLAPCGKGW